MQIGERLYQVASLVPACHTVADVGTDHGYIPAYLLLHSQCTRAIASDIAAGPCRAAADTCSRHGLQDRMEVRQAPGLDGLAPGEAQVVVIAGMGGTTIKRILEESPAIAASVETFVLQPMNGVALLRRWLAGHGYSITEERLCRENRHFYVIIQVCRIDKIQILTPLEEELGPCLLQTRPALWLSYVNEVLARFRRLAAQMERSPAALNSVKFNHIKNLIGAMERLMEEPRQR